MSINSDDMFYGTDIATIVLKSDFYFLHRYLKH
jgi:hypothetical protein